MKIFIFLLLLIPLSHADENYYREIVLSVGMGQVSFAENQKTIQGDNVSEIASGSVSAIVAGIQYSFLNDLNKQHYIHASFPLLPSATGQFMDLLWGIDYFFNDVASQSTMSFGGTTLQMRPTFRYFAGFVVGGGYLVYNTESATKSDIIFELGGKAGATYSVMRKWDARFDLMAIKGTGITTSSMIIKIFLGMSRNF